MATILRIEQYQTVNHVTNYLYELEQISRENTGNEFAQYAKLANMLGADTDCESVLAQVVGASESMIRDCAALAEYGFNQYDASTLTIVLDFHSHYGKVYAKSYVAYKTWDNPVTGGMFYHKQHSKMW